MVTRFDIIIFDLDGTLIDSTADITAATNRTLAELGLPPRSLDEVRQFVGDGARRLVERALGRGRSHQVEAALDRFREQYQQHLVIETVPYPGIPEMLEALAGIPLALASNKPARFIGPILAEMGWTTRFDPVVGGDSLAHPKPHAIVVETVCRRLGHKPSRTLMVGDGHQDVDAARAAGARSCGVTWGFRTRDELERAGADWIVDRPSELVDLIGSTS